MLRDNKGNRLFRRVEVKVVFPDKIFPDKKMVTRAEPHKGFGPDGIDDILMQVTDQLDTLFPWWEFRMQALAPEHRTAKFVFTFAAYRATEIQKTKESSALDPGTEAGLARMAEQQQPPSPGASETEAANHAT
jgi:hypothetical protein